MAGGNGDVERSRGNEPGRTPGGGWVPVPDPTALTTEAVTRATDVFRRELQAFRETMETRLAGNDEDRARVWERLRDLPSLYETFTVHLREELFRQDAHDREVVTQRLNDLDHARTRDASELAAELEHRRREFMANLDGVRDQLEQRLAGMDRALELMAGETARALASADLGDERTRAETRDLVTALRELIEQRLGAMDLATKVLAGSVEKFPSDIDRAVGNTREVVLGEVRRVQNVTEEKFNAIDGLFNSNDKALTAALAAQEKAAAEQQKSNTLAIDKSEKTTTETIRANDDKTASAISAQSDTIADLKERIVRIESTGAGVTSVTGTPFDAAGYQQYERATQQAAEIARVAQARAVMALGISAVLVLISLASVIFAITKK